MHPSLTRRLDPSRSKLTLDRQLSERFRRAILGGLLAPGDRVPSARAYALEVGVARGTVVAVYERLSAEGYLTPRGAAGTFVSATLPARGGAAHATHAPRSRSTGPASLVRAGTAPFQLGVPALDAFPMQVWSRLLSRRSRRAPARELARADPLGAPALRNALASYLAVSRGVMARPEQILITHGFQGALGLLTMAFPRARVWLEEPGYPLARLALVLAGARVSAVPVDEQGMDPSRAGRAAKPELIFVTASHQMPLGVPLGLSRRLALLALARRHEAFIVEDDYDGEFHYAGPPLPALASLERDAPVIYAGTLSKVMFPALRLGYLVVPEPLLERMSRLATLLGPAPGSMLQLALADFLVEGHFARHVKRMRHLYAERRGALLAALREHAAEELAFEESPGGLHVLARFTASVRVDDRAVVQRAEALGLAPSPFSGCFHRPDPKQQGLLLGFPPLPAARAEAHVLRLVQALS